MKLTEKGQLFRLKSFCFSEPKTTSMCLCVHSIPFRCAADKKHIKKQIQWVYLPFLFLAPGNHFCLCIISIQCIHLFICFRRRCGTHAKETNCKQQDVWKVSKRYIFYVCFSYAIFFLKAYYTLFNSMRYNFFFFFSFVCVVNIPSQTLHTTLSSEHVK